MFLFCSLKYISSKYTFFGTRSIPGPQQEEVASHRRADNFENQRQFSKYFYGCHFITSNQIRLEDMLDSSVFGMFYASMSKSIGIFRFTVKNASMKPSTFTIIMINCEKCFLIKTELLPSIAFFSHFIIMIVKSEGFMRSGCLPQI